MTFSILIFRRNLSCFLCVMDQFFLSFSLIFWVVLLSLWIMKVLKQPTTIAYILAGTIIAFVFPNFFARYEFLNTFSEVGIVFLLFIIWIELSPATIKGLWAKTVLVWILQVVGSTIAWFLISLLFWFDVMTSLYIGIATSLSSTIVVLKLLWDKDDLDSTYWRLCIWILVTQDILVMLFMAIVATFSALWGESVLHAVWILLIKILGIIWGLFISSKYLLPPITKEIAKSQEFLLLFSIGRCFIVSTCFDMLWFWMETWALFAWMTLAASPYRYEITSRMKVLKDFFIVIYFILLGANLSFNWSINWGFIAAGMFLVVILKPLIIMFLLKLMWHVKKNNFLTWVTEIPMSEFSFILITMGMTSWIITDSSLITLITIIGILSILISWYTTTYNLWLFKKLGKFQKYIPWAIHKKSKEKLWTPNDIILFWYGRLWWELYKHFQNKKYSVLIVDEHPAVINHLNTQWINCLYWDALDLEFLQDINLTWTKMIISTIANTDVNFALIGLIKEKNPNLIVICVATHVEEAIKLYEKWMDYVIMPHYIWADHTSIILEEFGLDVEKFLKNKSQQIEVLKQKSRDSLFWEFMKK